MKNEKLVEMTKDIVIAMTSTSNQFRAEPQSAQKIAESMDIIYNKLVELSKHCDITTDDMQ